MEQGYEEVNLLDYVKVVIKRKKFIIAVFLLFVVMGGIISSITLKTYRVSSSLEIGKIDIEGKNIEAPVQVKSKIDNDVYSLEIRKKLKISENNYPKLKSENPKDTDLIVINIDSRNTEQDKNILKEINNLILMEHQGLIKAKKDLIEKNIKIVEEKIKNSEDEKKNLEEKINALQKVLPYNQDPGAQFALFDTKEKLASKKQEIENLNLQIYSFESILDGISPTVIIKEPTVAERQSAPRPALNIAIAGVLGLFIGIFMAFSKEWWENNKKSI